MNVGSSEGAIRTAAEQQRQRGGANDGAAPRRGLFGEDKQRDQRHSRDVHEANARTRSRGQQQSLARHAHAPAAESPPTGREKLMIRNQPCGTGASEGRAR